MKKSLILLSLLVTMIVISCNEDTLKASENVIETQSFVPLTYINAMNTNASDVETIISTTDDINQFKDRFYNRLVLKDKNLIDEKEIIQLTGRSAKEGYQSVFGNRIQLNGRSISALGGESGVYVPQEINMSIDGNSKPVQLFEGSQIQWNVDENNENGIFISLTYLPDQTQLSEIVDKHPEPIVRYISLPEGDGSYRFTAEDLEGLPQFAIIDLLIGRGQFAEIDGNAIAAYTQLESMVVLQ